MWLPTYNEPVEVIAPAIAAACALQPAHQTWVLDDGDREWVAQLCALYGARYVRRDVHDHAKAGNMNHALDLMAREAAQGAEEIDIIAVLDCDHVPLADLPDRHARLVRRPEDRAGSRRLSPTTTREHSTTTATQANRESSSTSCCPGRNNKGVGPFWCGSTSLIRSRALREVGGVSTDTIVEDMHTTLALIRHGWKTAYHHQTLAVGLAPSTPEQYLLQRRRWGMGSMQVLVTERLWAAKRWLSWRNFYEYLAGTPVVAGRSGDRPRLPHSGCRARQWRADVDGWPTHVHRVLRRDVLDPDVGGQADVPGPPALADGLRAPDPAGAHRHLLPVVVDHAQRSSVPSHAQVGCRRNGYAAGFPTILLALLGLMAAVVLYALVGLTDWVPWHVTPAAAAASGVWLILAGIVLVLAIRRIQSPDFATSRRNAHRVPLSVSVSVNGIDGELTDISVGGAAARFPHGALSGLGAGGTASCLDRC